MLPSSERDDERNVAHCIEGESSGRPCSSHNHATDGRADAAHYIEGHAVQRDCGRDVFPEDDVAQRGLP